LKPFSGLLPEGEKPEERPPSSAFAGGKVLLEREKYARGSPQAQIRLADEHKELQKKGVTINRGGQQRPSRGGRLGG